MLSVAKLIGVAKGTRFGKWAVGCAAAAALAAPIVANAGPVEPSRDSRFEPRQVDYRRDFDRHDYDRDHDRGGFDLDVRFGNRPRYVDREVRVWVPAVYRTECEKLWVPDVYEDRQIRFFGRGQWHTRFQHVLIAPGHYEERQHQVLVCEGHYETRMEHIRVADSDFGFRLGR
jgi:hypothetical protein